MQFKEFILSGVLLAFSAASAADIQSQIDEAIATNQTKLVIAPGVYRLPARPNQPQLRISKARNLTVIADGVTIVVTSLDQAVRIQDCHNVELRGLSVDYDPLPFTQGVVIACAKDGTWMDVKIDEGYPEANAEAGRRAIIYDSKSGNIKPGAWTRFGVTVTPKNDGLVRLSWTHPIQDSLSVGNKVTITRRINTDHAMMIDWSASCTLRHVTLRASTGFGFYENYGDGNQYIGCSIKPGQPPEGAIAPRLLSSNADAFHSRCASRGPLVDECLFEAMGDDGIAIHGDYVPVVSAEGTRLVISPKYDMPFRTGDRLHAVSRDGLPTADVRIISIAPIELDDQQRIEQILQKYYPQLQRGANTFRRCYEVHLDTSLSIAEGSLVASPDRNGNQFSIRHNVIRDTRARGIIAKASNGVIENNLIEQTALAGIVLCPETWNWYEADYSENVVIRGNTLNDVMTTPLNSGMMQAGAISVCSEGDGRKYGPAGGHRHLKIENNRIERAVGTQILVTSAKDVTIRNNVFLHPLLTASGNGALYGVEPGKAIWIFNAEDIGVSDNQTKNP